MNKRDMEYVENRLLTPMAGASEAYTRLREVGAQDAAERLMRAMETFLDECRLLRRDLFYPDQRPKASPGECDYCGRAHYNDQHEEASL